MLTKISILADLTMEIKEEIKTQLIPLTQTKAKAGVLFQPKMDIEGGANHAAIALATLIHLPGTTWEDVGVSLGDGSPLPLEGT